MEDSETKRAMDTISQKSDNNYFDDKMMGIITKWLNINYNLHQLRKEFFPSLARSIVAEIKKTMCSNNTFVKEPVCPFFEYSSVKEKWVCFIGGKCTGCHTLNKEEKGVEKSKD